MPATARAVAGPVVADDHDDDAISAELGRRVRALRQARAMTLDQLAQRSGVSRAMISTVERGEKSPTLPIVVRLAAGLGTPLTSLLGAAPDAADVVVIRAADRPTWRDPESGVERSVLSPSHVDHGVELVEHRLPPGASTGTLPPYAAPTAKHVVVSSGRVAVHVGDAVHRLRTGDAMSFEVRAPYAFVNEDPRRPCVYTMVIVRRR